MTCYRPVRGYRRTNGSLSTKRQGDTTGQFMEVNCGQCIGCRLAYAQGWAIRCIHEAEEYDANSFVTLTYDPKNLPMHGSLVPDHFTNFMKKLRKKRRHPIRYFMAGEYGSDSGRPHYHAILFNTDFADKEFFSNRNGNVLFTSEELSKTWSLGFASVGSVTFESAGYVARYCMKKATGDHEVLPQQLDERTGEIYEVHPEYARMSRGRGGTRGLGHAWIEEYLDTVYPRDSVVFNGREIKPPKYYDKILQQTDPELWKRVCDKRRKQFYENAEENTDQRREIKEFCKLKKTESLRREL